MSENKGLRIQHRDVSLLVELFESRIMTSRHAAEVCFDGHRSYAKKRVRDLKNAGLIGAERSRVNEPEILYLSRKGLELLSASGRLDKYPAPLRLMRQRARPISELTRRHELAVMDVKAAFYASAWRAGNVSISVFSTWPALHQFEVSVRRRARVTKPDGFIQLAKPGSDNRHPYTFFLEVDRSTETLDTLVAKANAYLAFYKSGGFAERNGAARFHYDQFPFRVLMVFESKERRNNMADRLLRNDPPILKHACLAVREDVATDPFGRTWISPRDYRAALEGTPFDTKDRKRQSTCRRIGARDARFEERMVKSSILDD